MAEDGTSVRRRLVATKVLGDRNVPAGERTWVAEAEPMADPANEMARQMGMRALHCPLVPSLADLAAFYQGLIEDIRFVHVAEDAASSGAGSGDSSGDEQEEETEARHVEAGPRTVGAVHRGQGRVALTSFTSPKWIDGFLIAYEDPRRPTAAPDQVGFIWGGEYEFLVDYRRVSDRDLRIHRSYRPAARAKGQKAD